MAGFGKSGISVETKIAGNINDNAPITSSAKNLNNVKKRTLGFGSCLLKFFERLCLPQWVTTNGSQAITLQILVVVLMNIRTKIQQSSSR